LAVPTTATRGANSQEIGGNGRKGGWEATGPSTAHIFWGTKKKKDVGAFLKSENGGARRMREAPGAKTPPIREGRETEDREKKRGAGR